MKWGWSCGVVRSLVRVGDPTTRNADLTPETSAMRLWVLVLAAWAKSMAVIVILLLDLTGSCSLSSLLLQLGTCEKFGGDSE